MAVTVADVVVTMAGIPNATADGYLFYRLYDTKTTLIEATITRATRWGENEISEGTRQAEPDKFDDLVLYMTCFRILGTHIQPSLMATGFSYESLELRIDRKNFPDVVLNSLDQWRIIIKETMMQLKSRVEFFENVEYNVDPYSVWANNFRSTSGWGRGI